MAEPRAGQPAPDPTPKHPAPHPLDASAELSARQTGMSFQRTRLSAERTLMAAIRTSLSLIGFGFTIFQIFRELHTRGIVENSRAARNFGVALVLVGVVMILLGIGYHIAFMYGLRSLRLQLEEAGLIHGASAFPVSPTLIVAILLMIIGILAAGSMQFRMGPFG